MAEIDAKNIREMTLELSKTLTPIINAFIEEKKGHPSWETLTAIAHAMGIVAAGCALSQGTSASVGTQTAMVMRQSIADIITDCVLNPEMYALALSDIKH